MGQDVLYWHMPDEYTMSEYAHDGAHPLIVTHNGHGYDNGKILQIARENTGAIPDGEYQVANKSTNTYQLKHIKSGEELNGVDVIPRIPGVFSLYGEGVSDAMYPLFYGTITSLEESWSSSYGKIISFQARDHIQFLSLIHI